MVSVRTRWLRVAADEARAKRGSPWVAQPGASTRAQRRIARRDDDGMSPFANELRVLRCGATPRVWCKTDEERAAWDKAANARKARRRST